MSQSEGQVAVMVKRSRPSQTDAIFVTKNDLAEKVNVEDFIANRTVTAKTYPCVFDLTCFSVFCMAPSLASKFASDLPR